MKLKDIIGSMASKFAALALALVCAGNVWGADPVTIQDADGKDISVYEVSSGFYQGAATYDNTADFYITSKSGFVFFRDMVSACDGGTAITTYVAGGFYPGQSVPGIYTNNMFNRKTVHLLCDINLENEDWTPISYPNQAFNNGESKTQFYGNFDGHNHVVSNVKVVANSGNQTNPGKNWKNYGSYGLFGSLASNGATFRNLTVHNFTGVVGETVTSDPENGAGDYVGAIVGNTGSNPVTFSNCKVTGLIKINGDYTGAICGIGDANIVNCVVSGDDGSTISGSLFAGGLVGAERCSATSNLNITGNTISGVAVSSSQFVGSIVGAMASGSAGVCAITENDVVDCVIDGNDATLETLIDVNDAATATVTVANNTVRTTLIVETGDLTPAEEITPATTEVNYTVPVTVKDRSGNVVSETTAQEIAVSVANADIANTTLASVKIGDVVTKAVESVGEDATSVTAIEIQVKASTEAEGPVQSISYEVHPEAVVTVTKTVEEAQTTTESVVELSNTDLAADAVFTFELDVSSLNGVNVGDQVRVTHSWEAYTDAAGNSVAAGSETTLAAVGEGKKVRITTTHFSTWTLEGITIDSGTVAVVFAADGTPTQYTTLAAATAAAYDLSGDVTVQLIANAAESATICQKAGQNLTVNGGGNTLTGQLIVLGLRSASDATRTETLTIKSFNFTGADDKSDFKLGDAFVYFPSQTEANTGSVSKPLNYVGSSYVYAHNVTIADCSFRAADNDNPSTAKAVAIKSLSTGLDSIKLKNIDASYVHSIQFFSVQEAELDGVTLANTKNGINFNFETAGVATIRNSSICPVEAEAYGIRIQGAGHGVINLLEGTVISAYSAFETGNTSTITISTDGTINVQAGSYKGLYTTSKGNYEIVVTGGIFEQDPSDYVAEGYKATALAQSSAEYAAGYRYTIDPLPVVATVTANDVTTNFYDLHAALEAGKASGSVVTLLADVDLNNEPWTPVGTSSSKFCGVFNGNGHTISNLSVTATTDGSGLFGYAQNATISNVVLSAVNVSGANRCAALVGAPHVCVITDVTIEDAIVLSTGTYVGGILGNGYATVRNCVVKGTIGGDNTCYQVGGIAGYLCGVVDKCYVEADISGLTWLGGLVGSCQCDTTSAVTDSTFIGTVTGRGTYYGPGVAGLVGVFLGPGTTISGNYSDSVVTSCGTVIDCPVANYNCDDDGTGVKYFGNTDFSCMDGNSWNISTGAADTTTMREYDGNGAILETEPSVVARDADLVFAASDLASVAPGMLRFATGSQLNSESAVAAINAAGNYRAVLNGDGTVTVIAYVAMVVSNDGATKYTTLAAAIADAQDGNTIQLLKDVVSDARFSITKTLTIDGQGHTIAVNNNDNRVIDISDTSDVTLTLKNVIIDGSNVKVDDSYPRGISMYGNTNVKLLLDNASVSAGHYAVNVASENTGVEIEIKNSSVASGWAALNVWSPATISVTDSELSGTNNKSFDAAGWNNFSTIVLNNGAQDSELTFSNTKISSAVETQNSQWFVDVRCGDATIKFNTCEFVQTGMPADDGKHPDAMFAVRGTEVSRVTFTECTFTKDGKSVDQVDALFENTRFYSYPALYSDYIIDGTQYVVGTDGKVLEAVPGTVARDAGYNVTKGTFYAENDPTDTLADGYIADKNADGTYTVRVAHFVAQVNGGAKFESLQAAIDAAEDGDTVKLLTDVTVSAFVDVSKSITLDGDGHQLTVNATRGIRVTTGDVDVTVKNLVMPKTAKMERAIQVDSGKEDVSLTIDNVTATATMYTVNVCADVVNLDLTIKDSNLTGWGVVNLWGDNGTVVIEDSTLTGVNDKSYNADGWNDFGVIVVEGDTTGETDTHASAYDITIKDTAIVADSTNGNKQMSLLYNNPSVDNAITLENCTVELKNANCTFLCDNGAESVTKLKGTKLYETQDTLPALPDGYCYVDDGEYKLVAKAVAQIVRDNTVVAQYGTLAAAIADALNGDTVQLLNNVTLAEAMNVALGNKAVVLDLGGKTLAGRTNLKNGSLTIKNGTVAGGSAQALNVYGSADTTATNYSVLTIASDVNVTADVYGVCMFGATAGSNGYGAVVNIAGTVTTTGDDKNGAVFVSGNLGQNVSDDAHNVINVTGKITSATDAAIAMNGLATVNVSAGAEVTGNTAIAVKRGTLNVTDGTIHATGAKNYTAAAYYNGTEMTGAAISVSATYSKYGALAVNVSGGTVTSDNADAIFKQDGTYQSDATVAVSGGYFSSVVSATYCATGCLCTTAPMANGYYQVVPAATVTFVLDGNAPADAVKPENMIYPSDNPAKTALPMPTYTFADKTFAGWKVNGEGDAVSALPAGTTGNVTLTATWTDAEKVEVEVVTGGDKVEIVVPDAYFANKTEEVEQAGGESAYLETSDANGLKKWQNYVMGIDGSESSNKLAPIGGEPKSERIVVVKTPVETFTPPTADTGVTVKYALYWRAADSATWTQYGDFMDAPTFGVDIVGDITAAETYWKIEAVFTASSATATETSGTSEESQESGN